MFKVVAEQGSIIRASELLHCVPSNVTNRIKLLEEELGVSLFIRKGRGLVISPSGELFLSYTHRILSLCQEARRALDSEAVPSGILKIGAIESSATGRLPALLTKYHQRYPSVQMQFSTGVWTQLLNDVISHKLDGAVVAVKSEHPDIECVEIYKEPLVIVASPAMGHIHSPRDLNAMNIFMWPDGCPYRKALESWLDKHRIAATITSIGSYGAILGCVSAQAGVSLVPQGIFDQFKVMGRINGYTFTDLKPVQNYFVGNKHVGVHRAKDKFAALLKNEFDDV